MLGGMTRMPTRSGRASVCLRKRNGSLPRAAPMADVIRGATVGWVVMPTPMMRVRLWRMLDRTKARRRLARLTWLETRGNGPRVSWLRILAGNCRSKLLGTYGSFAAARSRSRKMKRQPLIAAAIPRAAIMITRTLDFAARRMRRPVRGAMFIAREALHDFN